MANEDILEWPVDTAEYIKVDVTAPVDPLADNVYLALVPRGQDRAPGDFAVAEWTPGQTWVDKDTPLTLRRFLAAGTLQNKTTYKPAVRVSDNPEAPVIVTPNVVRGVL